MVTDSYSCISSLFLSVSPPYIGLPVMFLGLALQSVLLRAEYFSPTISLPYVLLFLWIEALRSLPHTLPSFPISYTARTPWYNSPLPCALRKNYCIFPWWFWDWRRPRRCSTNRSWHFFLLQYLLSNAYQTLHSNIPLICWVRGWPP